MSILLVSKNRQLCACLRECFALWGQQSVAEVKSEAEADTALGHTRRHVRLVFVDGDLDSLDLPKLQGVAAKRASAPLMTWGWIHRSDAGPFARAPGGFHFAARRPFTGTALMKRLFRAGERTRRARSELLYLCSPLHLPHDFPSPALTGAWSEVSFAHSVADLEERFAESGQRIGSFWIDTRELEEDTIHWLRRFKKTFLGSHLPWVCVGRAPERTHAVRTLCQMYLDGADERGHWLRSLKLVGQRAYRSLETELRINAFRSAMRSRESKPGAAAEGRARVPARRADAQQRATLKRASRFLAPLLARRGPPSFEAELCAGELNKAQGRLAAARAHLARSLALHPCNPGAYAQLLALLEPGSPEAHRLTGQAREYCPGCPDFTPGRPARSPDAPAGVAAPNPPRPLESDFSDGL